jgi:precorrin-3B synthase
MPMQTGDGLIARLRPLGAIGIDAWTALCAATVRHGNGIVEVTARGGLQFRGLSPDSAGPFANTVATLAIPAADRPAITTSGLAGYSPASLLDATALATTLAASCADLPLHAKFSITIDDGSTPHLDALAADLRLRAVASPEGVRLYIAAGGPAATPLGAIAPEHTVEAITQLLTVIAGRRMRDVLSIGGLAPLQAAAARWSADAQPLAPRSETEPLSLHCLDDRRAALGVALAFGHSHADSLVRLGRAAQDAGAVAVRPLPGRALLLIGVLRHRAAKLTVAAETLGFITQAGDPRRWTVACSGAPACNRGEAPARALAPQTAAALAAVLSKDCVVHLSGCAKGCAHPAPAWLTLTGAAGDYRLIPGGRAADLGCGVIPATALPRALEQIATAAQHARQPGEFGADVLSRLGARQIAAAALGHAENA